MYAELSDTIDHMIGRLGPDDLPKHLKQIVHDKRPRLVEHLQNMKARVDAIDTEIKNGHVPSELQNYEDLQNDRQEVTAVTLQSFFEIQFKDPPMRQLAQLWKYIFDELPDHLCLPWVQIQQSGQVVSRKDMEDHKSSMKGDTLKDLFTTKVDDKNPRNKRLLRAVKDAREKGILARQSVKGHFALIGGGGDDSNDKSCTGEGCGPGNTFCNEDIFGNCTVVSTSPKKDKPKKQ